MLCSPNNCCHVGTQNWLHHSASIISKSIPLNRIEYAVSSEQPSQAKERQKNVRPKNPLSLEQMTSVIWQTPLGLPVVQPYRRLMKKQMATAVQTVFIHDPLVCSQVSPQKQASAFPPNFVHSLDATHMMLTALECHSAGLTFDSVHDSYWTHACDIDTMSDIIRDTFVRLHSQDILGRLREEFLERYKDHYLPVVKLKQDERARLAKELSPEAAESLVVDDDTALDAAGASDTAAGAHTLEAEVIVERKSRAQTSASTYADEETESDAESVVEPAEDDDATALGDAEEGDALLAGASDTPEAAEGLEVTTVSNAADSTRANKKKNSKSKTGATKGKASKRGEQIALKAQFVPLSKLLKPIPAKGTFDVSETKVSLMCP